MGAFRDFLRATGEHAARIEARKAEIRASRPQVEVVTYTSTKAYEKDAGRRYADGWRAEGSVAGHRSTFLHGARADTIVVTWLREKG